MKSNLENMFKVGDWVVTTNRGVWQIMHEIELASWELTLGSESKLWKPKQGDWCWFYDNKYDVPEIGQYDCVDTISKCYVNTRGPMRYHIEPFIGELPSLLR